MRSAIFDKLSDKDIRSARQSEIDARDRAKQTLDKLNRERVPTAIEDNATIAETERAQAELKAAHNRLPELNTSIDAGIADYVRTAKSRKDLSPFQSATTRYNEVGQLSNTPAGADAIDSVKGAEATAGRFMRGQPVSGDQQKQLIDTASRIAGHQVDLSTAVRMMDAAAKNMDVFAQDVLRLAGTMATNQEALATKVKNVEDRVTKLGNRLR